MTCWSAAGAAPGLPAHVAARLVTEDSGGERQSAETVDHGATL